MWFGTLPEAIPVDKIEFVRAQGSSPVGDGVVDLDSPHSHPLSCRHPCPLNPQPHTWASDSLLPDGQEHSREVADRKGRRGEQETGQPCRAVGHQEHSHTGGPPARPWVTTPHSGAEAGAIVAG